jgi:hypothetical protein
MIKKVWQKLRGHFQEYVARYSVLALAVLTPAAGLLGEMAADLGGVNTGAGRVVLAAASALGTAAAGVVFIRNLGIWQMLDAFGVAPGAPSPPVVAPAVQPTALEPMVGTLVGAGAQPVEPVEPMISDPASIPPDVDASGLAANDGEPSDRLADPDTTPDEPLADAPDLVDDPLEDDER